MADATMEAGAAQSGPMLAADGTPLKKSLARSLRVQKIRALLLIAPLLIFVLVTFIAPIADMLFRSVENQIVSDTLPRTTAALESWDSEETPEPGEDVYEALYFDMALAIEAKEHTKLGTRLNYEKVGISSLFRKTGRALKKFETDTYTDLITDHDKVWEDPAHWASLPFTDLPRTAAAWGGLQAVFDETGKEIKKKDLDDFLYTAVYLDLADNPDALPDVSAALASAEPISLKTQFIESNEDWADPEVFRTIQTFSPSYTSGYFLNAVDMQLTPDGTEARPESQQIYGTLFGRTMYMSLVITFSCILLGYPVAWILANLPMRTANLLMILVLLPFWTSLLVRTSAWKVMLQDQGVVNSVLVWLGLLADDGRLALINNQTGTIIAMTHILLPFMILPMYSVMQTIPPSYLRAAKSLGATNWTAFWRVYFPQSVPGIGAGSILVFILAIGYYITPEIVGGRTGTFISNRIAYHISSSLNWGLGAALGAILLGVVLILYWAYDKIVGIDNVKLGG